jgi:GDP-4-dehydro-6-deoxy-D-mannose reductase
MKKILITGATGFAGSFLAEHLVHTDATVYGTYLSDDSTKLLSGIRDKITLKKLNLLDLEATEELVNEIKPQEVYHLAALASAAASFKNPADTMRHNIESQMHLFEAIKKAQLTDCKILITSSAEIYGNVDASDLPVNEQTPLRPVSPYAVSKIAQDFMGLQYFLAHKLHIVRVRPFNHVGPRQSPVFVISSFAKQIAESEKSGNAVLRVGNLDAKRDFTDVRDMVRSYPMLMEKGSAGDVYNIGSGTSRRIGDVLEQLLSFAKTTITAEVDPDRIRPIDVPDIYADASRMKAITGWEPSVPFEQTLQDTLEYWRQIV